MAPNMLQLIPARMVTVRLRRRRATLNSSSMIPIGNRSAGLRASTGMAALLASMLMLSGGLASSTPIGSTPPTVIVRHTPAPSNEIGHFRAGSVSTTELQVTVDYAYGGSHGADEIFLHAAALRGKDIKSRIPGTGFPGEAVSVGRGSVTLTITKTPVLDTGAFTSTSVRVCLVSMKRRSAFLCRNFPHMNEWE